MQFCLLAIGVFSLVVGVHSFAEYQHPPAYLCPEFGLYPCNCTKESDEGIVVVCENTNLASMSVGLKQSKVKIANLTIINCNIERLYGDVFRSNEVTKIVIEDTPIRSIENDTFIEVGEFIEELILKNTRLETFPYGALQSLSKVHTIKIDNSDLEEIPPNAFKGLPKLKEIQVSNSHVKTLDIAAFLGQRNLKFLRLHNNNITTIVKKTFDFGQSLELLDLSHNHINVIGQHDFSRLTKLLWLNLTDNGIDSFTGRLFGRNQLLAVLHLAENNITKLDANSFRGMRFLRRLYFENNQISQIGRQTFQTLKRIGGIYLRGNQMTKIAYQMFDGLRYADTIDVSYNQIKQVDKNTFKELYLATINMSHNQIEEFPADVFIQCDNLTLDISHNNIRDIHPDAFDELSYAFWFDASYNALTSMSQVPMKYQKGIKFLDLSHNQIIDIPKKSFPKLYELNTINYSYNNLTTIGRSVFASLFSIRHLNFSHNHLELIESSTFGKIPTVLDVDLSHNRINTIKRGAFGGLVSVRTIYLDHNQLTEIPRPPISLNYLFMAHNKVSIIRGRQPWPVMNSLISLDLDFNSFGDSLEGGRFAGLNVLRSLKLRGNNMTKPPSEALGALLSLRTLNLDYNNFTVLPKKSFGRLPVVFNLTLGHNNINNISTGAFEGFLQLILLDINSNNLTYIPPGAFKTLVSLQHLDLSHNKLKRLSNKTHGLLEDCLSLRTINLSHNKIPFLTKKMFPESRWTPYKLQEIDLSYNMMPVLTDGILIGTKHLKKLNVSHNILNDVRKYVLGNLTSLESLDMSHNKLTESKLRSDRWGGPFNGVLNNLTYFSLAHNDLYSIPSKLIAQFPVLKTLDLTGNDLIHYYPEFTAKIKSGLDLRYAGNILRCECSLRPVVHWLRAARRDSSWDTTHCHSPGYLSGKLVSDVREEQLVCDNSEEALDYKISPDVKFREVDETYNSVAVSWYVNTNEDVADFRVELASLAQPRPKTLLVKDIGYNARYDVIDSVPGGEELRMCLLVKTSLGRIRRWRQDQCQSIGPFSAGNRSGVPVIPAILAVLSVTLLINLAW
eukprot:GFUD01027655.1.p1 GENE.GFUD01027655.1~~GFUD01027655.1.p1  ORF type:complete len:1068 (-),score=163.25 GFUD01027655.1:152-3355(-)